MGTVSGGKIFWPAVPQGDIFESIPQAAWQTAVNAWFTAMLAGFTNAGITWLLGVYSKKHNSFAQITGHQFSPLVGFLKKRKNPTGAV
jgi:hypothetical protein